MLASAQRRMLASEGSFMGSDGADRPGERPRQGSEKPLPRRLIHAICGRSEPAQHRRWHVRSSRHDRLSSIWASGFRMSRYFRGYRVDLVHVPNICVKRASHL